MNKILIFLFIPWFCFAQNKMDHNVELSSYETGFSVVTFHDYQVKGNSIEQDLVAFIIKNNRVLQGSELVLEYAKPSKAGFHYNFIQRYNGREVYLGRVKVNTDRNNRITSVIEKVFDASTVDPFLPFPEREKIEEYLLSWSGLLEYEIREVYGFNGVQLIPAVCISLTAMDDKYYEVLIDYFGHELYRRDLMMYHKVDSTLTGKVFLPDPLTSAGVLYGAPYTDSNDSDKVELNQERYVISAQGTYSQGVYRLENQFVKLTEFSNPVTALTTSAVSSFDFMRSEDGFEDFNAYYHLNRFKNYLNNSGYPNLVDYQIEVDAHALNGADNSAFQGTMDSGKLFFGDGGVDDAEDADVIIHEYAHAISTSASNSNIGVERRTVDEGLSDYFAAMYSKHINSFDFERVYSWDGHNEFWAGRQCTTNKCYSNIVFGSSVHQHADLFSSFLLSVSNSIGIDATAEILLESMYSYSINISMRDAALLFLQADTLLFGGIHGSEICNMMQQYCFNPCASIGYDEPSVFDWELRSTAEFAIGGELGIVGQQLPGVHLEMTDAWGRKVPFQVRWQSEELRIQSTDLTPGVYFLSISNKLTLQSFKLIRY